MSELVSTELVEPVRLRARWFLYQFDIGVAIVLVLALAYFQGAALQWPHVSLIGLGFVWLVLSGYQWWLQDQRLLKVWQYDKLSLDNLQALGYPKTVAGVRHFQRNTGLPEGVLDTETMYFLNCALVTKTADDGHP